MLILFVSPGGRQGALAPAFSVWHSHHDRVGLSAVTPDAFGRKGGV